MRKQKPSIAALSWPVLLAILSTSTLSCSQKDSDGDDVGPETGYVSGLVRDLAGKPLRGVKILVDNSIFYNSNITGYSNNEGKYKIRVPDGAWYAIASHQVEFEGKNYTLYLHPENPAGFGREGGVRNFSWKLSGVMPEPLSGNYGGLITLDNVPGVYLELQKADFTLTPSARLIDGSEGQTIRVRSADGYQIRDVPIGKYKVKATYEGKPLKFRRWNSEETFQEEYEIQFTPQIDAQCYNCFKLEYTL